MDILNALVLLGNFLIIPGLAYGCQLALGALGIEGWYIPNLCHVYVDAR